MAYIFSYTSGGSPVSTLGFRPSNYGEFLFCLKELLKAAGWTAVKSGDGLSAYSATTDILTATGTGANGCNNPGAWILMQMPTVGGLNRQMLFRQGTTTNNRDNGYFNAVYSASGVFTGGAANTRPNAIDGIFVPSTVEGYTTSTDSRTNDNLFNAVANSLTFNMAADDGTTAGAKYGFFVTANATGNSSSIAGAIFLDPMVANSYDASDSDPYVVCASYNSGAFGISNDAAGYMTIPRAIYKRGAANEYGSVVLAMQPGPHITSNSSSTTVLGNLPINPLSGKDDIFPVFYGRVNNRFSSTRCFLKGQSSLLRCQGQARSVGDTYSILSTRDRYVYGNYNFPWNGSVPVV